MSTASQILPLPTPFPPRTYPWHMAKPSSTSHWASTRLPNLWRAVQDPYTMPNWTKASSRSSTGSRSDADAEYGIKMQTGQMLRPRRASQRLRPTIIIEDEGYETDDPPAHGVRRSSIKRSKGISKDVSKNRKKKRLVREGTCANCGCDQSETTLWRTNPLDRTLPATKIRDESLLCNACGIWTGTHGTPRPSKFWDLKRRPIESGDAKVSEEEGRKVLKADEEDHESQDSSLEDSEGADVLSAAEALLGLKHLGRNSSPCNINHRALHSTSSSPSVGLTTPPAPIHHSENHHRTRSRGLSRLDPEPARVKPPKRRRAASPSAYVRSASVGCTSLPPSIQRQWSGRSTSSTEQTSPAAPPQRLPTPTSTCMTRQPWQSLMPKRQDVL